MGEGVRLGGEDGLVGHDAQGGGVLVVIIFRVVGGRLIGCRCSEAWRTIDAFRRVGLESFVGAGHNPVRLALTLFVFFLATSSDTGAAYSCGKALGPRFVTS